MLKGCKQKTSETAMCCSSAWFNPSSPALFGLEKRGVRGGSLWTEALIRPSRRINRTQAVASRWGVPMRRHRLDKEKGQRADSDQPKHLQ